MREIKFRYIYKFENEFEIEYFTLKDIEIIENVNNYFTKNLIARHQYTGLHDQNGKEIYEGDVVHGSYGIPPRGVDSVVEYQGSAFIINTKGHNPESVTLKTALECLDLEVVGIPNIY